MSQDNLIPQINDDEDFQQSLVNQLLDVVTDDDQERAAVLPDAARHIVMLVYPGMFPLDLVGPLAVLGGLMNTEVHHLWKNTDPLACGSLTIVPSGSFADCPDKVDVLLIPGGTKGTLAAMQDPEVLDFVRQVSQTATYVTSVCTGSLILGAAGVLDGYQATTHWAALDSLPHFGARPVQQRFVEDGNRLTAAGVSAGIDFALHLAARLTTESFAKTLQLDIEYDPSPPFRAGTPADAGDTLTTVTAAMYGPFLQELRKLTSRD